MVWRWRPARTRRSKSLTNSTLSNQRAGLADPEINARLADLGATALSLSPREFGKLFADEIEKWGKVVRAANIKV